MKPGTRLFASCTVLAACLSQLPVADAWCRCLKKPASDRGIAILSPWECPDPCPTPPVGGCYVYTPYYPGYVPDRRCLPNYGATMTNGYEGAGTFGHVPAPYARNDYGSLTGATKDEASLLRLGGQGASSTNTSPVSRNIDLIDRIQGGH